MGDDLLTTADVAAMFRVHPKTVRGWVRSGILPSIRTPGGQLRFRRADVEAAIMWGEGDPGDSPVVS